LGGDVSLHSVTFAGNLASLLGSALYSEGHLTLTNTLVAGACDGEPAWTTTSNGGNLESPGDTCGMEPAIDLVNVPDPMLCGLVNTGGSTATLVPFEASPAVGNGNDTYCLDVDQRGLPRSGVSCEVGAVERQADDVLFADGFESRDLTGWSGSTP
jgi:predicted outer membrane repeat protein